MVVPAPVERVVVAGGEGGVVEEQRGFSAARLELEADKRVEAGGPSGRTPGLDDPPIGYQFNVTAFDEAAKHRKRTAGR